jgi:hypothetical protein
MKRECAWCGAMLGQVEPLENNRTTHGICRPCSDVVEGRAEQSTEPHAVYLPVRRPEPLGSNG